MKPLEDKLEELLLQRHEFDKHLETLQRDLEATNVGSKRRSDLIKIKIEFERELDRFKSALPMYARKSEITRSIGKNQVCIILGETGSGKSTQILQYLHGAGLTDHGTIVCTQPRKVAAISLARRVSEEMRCTVGQLVGYRVGMQSEQNVDVTRLLYVTDHVLLNDCLKDPLFKAYSCIVIDEAHERSIYSDLLLGFVKRALPLRSDLRVVIMSATINPDLFVSYFSGCCASMSQTQSSPPVLRISGRAYPVDVEYNGIDAKEDYVTEAVEKALELHRGEPPGDILVFLTSPIETEQACKKLNQLLKTSRDVILLELHGRLQVEDQQKIFDPTPEGMRKIVFATNSAETSITIPGIKYVVDTGRVREVNYDPKRNVSELAVQWVTRSSAEQRKGRAGRTDCGKCVRLYSEEQYKEMRPDSVPEILRVHLGQALLKLMMLGVVDATKFDFVEAPDKDAIVCAQTVLRELEAYDDNGITEVGKKLTKLLLEPRLGKVALKGIDEGIPFESIVMAAVSTVGGSIFFRAGSDEEKRLADRKKTRFCDEWGDIVTLVNVYKECDSLPLKDLNRWCKENSINAKSMRTARNTVSEIEWTFKHELNITIPHRFSNDAAANEKMAKILFECYTANLSRYCGHRQEGYCVVSTPDMILHIHPSSSLNYVEDSPQWVVHEKILTTSRPFMLNATFVKDSWIKEKRLTFSADQLRESVVVPHPTIYSGRSFISRLLKGKAQLKKELECNMRSKGAKAKAVIDVVSPLDCCGGSITVHSTPFIRQSAADLMNDELLKTTTLLMNEVVEEPLFPNSSVRIVVGHGAQITSIVNESRRFVKPMKQERCNQNSDFTVRVIAQRRPLKGFGYISFSNSAMASAVAARVRQFMVARKSISVLVPIQQDKKRTEQCYMKSVPVWADTEIIKTSLLKAIGLDIPIQNIILPRVSAPSQAESSQLLGDFQTFLSFTLLESQPFTAEDFEINLQQRRNDKDFDMRAFLKFSDPNLALQASKLLSRATFQQCPVDATLDLKTSLVLPKHIHSSLKAYIDKKIAGLKSKAVEKLSIDIQERPQYKVVAFKISTSCLSDLILAIGKLSGLIKGHSVQLSGPQYSYLKSTAGSKLLEKFPIEMHTNVVLDWRLGVAVIYGSRDKVLETEQRLADELRITTGQLKKTVGLGGASYPKGMMKAVIVRYGPDLEQLRDMCGATSLDLVIRQHQLQFVGSAEAYGALVQILGGVAADLPGVRPDTEQDRLPECPVCLTDVEADSFYVMECCRHVYCKTCVNGLVENAIRSNEIPIRCAADGCGLDVAIQDLKNVRDQNLSPVYEVTLRAFMNKRSDEYKPCLTPDCPMIFRATPKNQEGYSFNCTECHLAQCTSCHVAYHVGYTCALYRLYKDDPQGSLLEWVKEDPIGRSLCPKCEIGIQKDGGCNHMTCTACGIHICWVCKKETFKTAEECYEHLGSCQITN